MASQNQVRVNITSQSSALFLLWLFQRTMYCARHARRPRSAWLDRLHPTMKRQESTTVNSLLFLILLFFPFESMNSVVYRWKYSLFFFERRGERKKWALEDWEYFPVGRGIMQLRRKWIGGCNVVWHVFYRSDEAKISTFFFCCVLSVTVSTVFMKDWCLEPSRQRSRRFVSFRKQGGRPAMAVLSALKQMIISVIYAA